MNGTMVNFQGNVQRIRPAVATAEMDRSLEGMSLSRLDKFGTEFDRWNRNKKLDALPSWEIIQSIASFLGLRLKYNMSEEIFEDIAKTIEEFKGLNYDIIGEHGVLLKVKAEVV
jgi:NADH dehydrogenase/NADH:ubiquinone oxidoreductase subunit G